MLDRLLQVLGVQLRAVDRLHRGELARELRPHERDEAEGALAERAHVLVHRRRAPPVGERAARARRRERARRVAQVLRLGPAERRQRVAVVRRRRPCLLLLALPRGGEHLRGGVGGPRRLVERDVHRLAARRLLAQRDVHRLRRQLVLGAQYVGAHPRRRLLARRRQERRGARTLERRLHRRRHRPRDPRDRVAVRVVAGRVLGRRQRRRRRHAAGSVGQRRMARHAELVRVPVLVAAAREQADGVAVGAHRASLGGDFQVERRCCSFSRIPRGRFTPVRSTCVRTLPLSGAK